MKPNTIELNRITMKTVFVPTDFSEYAAGGVTLAKTIANKVGCPIILHHNVNSLVTWEGLTELQKMEHPHIFAKTLEAEQKLDTAIANDFDREQQVRKVITHGVPAEEIIKSAKQNHADLIIMGSHGNENSQRFFVGSNIQRVIRTAMCPVLAAKKEVEMKDIKTIVFPYQFDDEIDKAFGQVKKFAKELNATVHLLFVNSPQRFMDTRDIQLAMDEFCEKHKDINLVKGVYDHQDPVSGILEYCEDVKADLVALVTHDRRHSAKYMIGITEALVFHSDLPVLSVNAAAYSQISN